MLMLGKRAFAVVAALLMAVFVGAQPAMAAPAQATITFPDGNEALTGGTLRVTFDAGGDTETVGFRYSMPAFTFDRAVAADTPGGSATVSLDIGSSGGDLQVHVVGVDADGTRGPANQATIHVTITEQFKGFVSDPMGRPVPGAVVTIEPGNRQEITDSRGAFAFTGVPTGEYLTTASATVGNCPMAARQTLYIDKHGVKFRFTLWPVDGECPPAEEEPVPPATLNGVIWPTEAEATVTLEPGGLRATANEFGWYEIPGIEAGTYTVTATAGVGCWSTESYETTFNGYEQTLNFDLRPVDCP